MSSSAGEPRDASDAEARSDAALPGVDLGALPACAADAESSSCVFVPAATHGPVSAFHVHGDYLYWLELGSTDQRQNYQYDGVLVRVRVGGWQREEILTELDLYDEASRQLEDCQTLQASADHVMWGCYGHESRYVRLAEQPRRARELGASVVIDSCAHAGDVIYCSMVDNVMARRSLALDDTWETFENITDSNSFFYSEGYLYFGRWPNNWSIGRLDLREGSPGLETLMPGAKLVDVLPGRRLLGQLNGDWIGVASDTDGGLLGWKAVAGPGDYVGSAGGWIYWYVLDQQRLTFIRTGLDGNSQSTFSSFDYPSGIDPKRPPMVTAQGLIIDLRNRHGWTDSFAFLPALAEPSP